MALHLNKSLGRIKIYIGCMFSGKSLSMAINIRSYVIANKKCVIVKHASDTRYGADSCKLILNSGEEVNDAPIIVADDFDDVLVDKLNKYDVICVDEAQFYPNIVDHVQALANNGKIVIIAGLDADFKGDPFIITSRLIAIAEEVVKLHAVCHLCQSEANFTVKLPSADSSVLFDVGSTDKYMVVCRNCRKTF
jgi:thymidine kinase